jgi:hypothetical protein
MVCRITSINLGSRPRQAFTLVELMVAAAAGLLSATVIAVLLYFTSRSFVAATNYTDMSLASRMCVDSMSRTIRQASLVTAHTTNSLTVRDKSGNSTQYTFNPNNHTLLSVSGGQTTTYLTGCDTLQFWIYQRTPISNTFDCYKPANVTNTKLVQVTWKCSRQILGAKVNTETMETAKICLRNH